MSANVRVVVALPILLLAASSSHAEWQPAQGRLMTRWAKDVKPERVHPEYPRPQMVRPDWLNLNGLWDYAIRGKDEPQPTSWDGQILVPFPVESALSGVMKSVGPDKRLWYRRTFSLPRIDGKTSPAWSGKRILLHLGAVDWEATVWLNDQKVGSHRGGYDPFTFDITDRLVKGENILMVEVTDPSDAGFQPRGKQVQNPHGIWYTPTTGIWQTVWLEPVPKTYIRSVRIDPNLDEAKFRFMVDFVSTADREFISASVGDRTAKATEMIDAGSGSLVRSNEAITVSIDKAKLWSPGNPFLYDIEVTIRNKSGKTFNEAGKTVLDRVVGYAAMRKISLGKDEHGVTRIMLNNKPLFQYGPLDQGFWPDGLYTAPTDEALRYDIEMTKKLGFNMIRKHVKVEPDRWYYHCDKLGMLVWQDMPSGDKHAAWDPFGKHDNTEATRSPESSENYNREWKAIIDSLRNHPSIVMWVPFNEGWGQANTVAVTKWTKEYDPTRLVNCASGGNDFPVGDVIDVHRYPGPFAPKPTNDRAAVLGEFGGLGLPLEGHTWQGKDNWGYRSFTAKEELQRAYVGLLGALRPMIAQGVSAAVYTQTTDVEIEVNGLMTYDRAVLKMDADTIAKAARKLYLPPPKVTVLVPTSEQTAQTWRFTTDKPSDGWQKPDFDDSSWKSGPGGFGEPSTPGSVVKTNWKTNDIWLRRDFDLKAEGRTLNSLHDLALRIHHDEDTEVFLNGELIARTTGYTTQYVEVPLEDAARKLLKPSKNSLAVHCKQTGGGQYIDVGLVDVEEVSR